MLVEVPDRFPAQAPPITLERRVGQAHVRAGVLVPRAINASAPALAATDRPFVACRHGVHVVEAGLVLQAQRVVVVGQLVVDEPESVAPLIGCAAAVALCLGIDEPGLVLGDEVVQRHRAGLLARCRDCDIHATPRVAVEPRDVVINRTRVEQIGAAADSHGRVVANPRVPWVVERVVRVDSLSERLRTYLRDLAGRDHVRQARGAVACVHDDAVFQVHLRCIGGDVRREQPTLPESLDDSLRNNRQRSVIHAAKGAQCGERHQLARHAVARGGVAVREPSERDRSRHHIADRRVARVLDFVAQFNSCERVTRAVQLRLRDHGFWLLVAVDRRSRRHGTAHRRGEPRDGDDRPNSSLA